MTDIHDVHTVLPATAADLRIRVLYSFTIKKLMYVALLFGCLSEDE